jgi:hypothetical protein
MDECKKCEKLSPRQSSSIRSERLAIAAASKAELARVLEKRRSDYIKELEAKLRRAQEALKE